MELAAGFSEDLNVLLADCEISGAHLCSAACGEEACSPLRQRRLKYVGAIRAVSGALRQLHFVGVPVDDLDALDAEIAEQGGAGWDDPIRSRRGGVNTRSRGLAVMPLHWRRLRAG